MAASWWERDVVNVIASGLDAASLASFSESCVTVNHNLCSKPILKWLADLRGLDRSTCRRIDTMEHLQIAQVALIKQS